MRRSTLSRLRLLAEREDRAAAERVRREQEALRELEQQTRIIADYRDKVARCWTDGSAAPAWMAACAAAFTRAADQASELAEVERRRHGETLDRQLEEWRHAHTRCRRIDETDSRLRRDEERRLERSREKEQQGRWRRSGPDSG